MMSGIFLKNLLKLILVGVLLIPSNLKASDDEKGIRTIIHLLDYIGKDYPGAVENGKIKSAIEYQEMADFANTIKHLSESDKILQKDEIIIGKIKELIQIINQKAPPVEISILTKSISLLVINRTKFKAYPKQWPDLNAGKSLFQNNCVSCHGTSGNGNGELAKNLNPKPTNFLNDSLAENSTPFQAYNSIRLGVSGTGMLAFSDLSEEEVWDLAFYVKSLNTADSSGLNANLKKEFKEASKNIDLKQVATLTDINLKEKLGNNKNAEQLLASLRLHSENKKVSENSLNIAKKNVLEALNAYRRKEYKLAREKALSAYLDGIEPVETRLRANDPKFTASIEKHMLLLRLGIEDREGLQVIEKTVEKNIQLIGKAGKMLVENKLSFWLSLLLSASIVLREGLEAFLIIAVILAIIKNSGIKRALPWLHGGWIAAVFMGCLGWYLSGWILHISGKNREIMEGVVALFAVVVLTVVGFWLHNNSHARKWKVFIEERINKLLNKESMFSLAVFSFMVVFREAFETVLFLQAISLETPQENQLAIGMGVLSAFVIIAFLMILFIRFSKSIPVRQLFRYSAWMITLLAVILVGQGVHAIQESGIFSITEFPFNFRIEWAGIYPTFETMLSQALLLAGILFLYHLQTRRIKLGN